MDNWKLAASLAEVNLVKPLLYVGPRADKVLYGANGGELSRIVDRPFRGYGVNK